MSSSPESFRLTLGLRLAAWYAALFTAGAVLLLAVTYALLTASLRQRDHDTISALLERYVSEYARGGLPRLNEAIEADRLAGRHGRMLVRVVGRRAEALFYTLPSDWSEFDLTDLDRVTAERAAAWSSIPSRRGPAALDVASVRLGDGTLFQVGRSTENRTELLIHFRAVSLFVVASIVLLGGAGATALTWRGLRPVRALAETVRRIVTTGDLSARVAHHQRGDALDDLGAQVNVMLDRIEALIAGMRGALDNVAHDLRTPMTRLRGIAETALSRPDDAAALRDALALCVDESDRVTGMLEALMDISEAETGTMALQREPVRVADLFQDTLELYLDVAEEKGIALAADPVAASLVVDADRSRLRQVLSNLVDNAIKYTAPGGRVTLSAVRAGAGVELTVRDNGVGIAPEDLPRIWDRLYRGDTSRHERGLGLGLSLVRAIARAHGGDARVESRPGEGAAFTVALP